MRQTFGTMAAMHTDEPHLHTLDTVGKPFGSTIFERMFFMQVLKNYLFKEFTNSVNFASEPFFA